MSLQQAIGKACAGNRGLESLLVWLGHAVPGSRIVRSLCYHAGEAIALKDPTTTRTAETEFGSKLSVRLDEHIFRHIYFHGQYEADITEILQKLVKPGQTWLDVGANVGFFTILLSKGVGTTGHVHAFEPNPAMQERVRESIALNGASNITLVPQAVSNVSGQEISIYVPQGQDHNSGRTSAIQFADVSNTQEVKVTTTSLDDYIEKMNITPDFMKIDIEGFEINAFRGLERTMRSGRPKLIISELSQLPGVLATPMEIITYLSGFDYVPYKVGDRGLIAYVKGEAVDPRDMNFVFIQKNVAGEIARTLAK